MPSYQDGNTTVPSELAQWPCQIRLVPATAPFFKGAKLLIAADCTAYAYAAFHRDFMRGNLMETAQRLTRMKQIRNQQLLFGMIVLVVWMGWLVYEVYMAGHSAPAGSDLLPVSWCYLGGIFVGGVIGLILGLKIFFKMQRTNDEIIDQIEEMEIEK
jgi:membrane associated rhomboid family serine protease